MRHLVALPVLLVLAAAASASDPDGPGPDRPSGDAAQDLLFLGEGRPVFLRLYLYTGDRGFRSAWREALRSLHADLDRDGDGSVPVEEVDLETIAGLARTLTGAPATVRAEDLDPDGDGTVAAGEFADALADRLSPFEVEIGRTVESRTDALFERLDRDGDGALSARELAAAGTSLRKLDLDDDELIADDELEPFADPMAMQMDAMSTRRGRYAQVGPVIDLAADGSSLRTVRQLLRRYDTGDEDGVGERDNTLSPAEFGIDPGDFKRADADGDGSLDTVELRRHLGTLEPEAELIVTLSPDASGDATLEVVGTGGPDDLEAKRLSPRDVELTIGEVRLEVHVDDGAGAADAAKQYYADLLEAADVNGDGYLERDELGEDDHGPLAPLFDLMDADGDGKLFPEEVAAYIDRQAEAARGRMVLTASDRGRAVFTILDLDRDRRLGVRELRSTVDRVSDWDLDGDGLVTADEVPHHYQLILGRGRLNGLRVPTAAPSPSAAMAESDDTPVGPDWFRHMDRNGDGDVSPREFLGPRDAFAELDRDADGLLDPGEASGAGGAE